MTIINNVKVLVEENYLNDEPFGNKIYSLILEIPLPGGKAIYEQIISKEFKENLEKASKLSLNKV